MVYLLNHCMSHELNQDLEYHGFLKLVFIQVKSHRFNQEKKHFHRFDDSQVLYHFQCPLK